MTTFYSFSQKTEHGWKNRQGTTGGPSNIFILTHVNYSDTQTSILAYESASQKFIKYLAAKMHGASLIPGVHLQMDYCLV